MLRQTASPSGGARRSRGRGALSSVQVPPAVRRGSRRPEKWGVSGDLPQPARHWKPRRENYRPVDLAGLPRRFVAVLLDGLIVFLPVGIVVGLLSGGGYAESGNGYANAGIDIGGQAFWLLLALGIGYYVFFESATGATLGKRMVGIRVVGEDGEQVTF